MQLVFTQQYHRKLYGATYFDKSRQYHHLYLGRGPGAATLSFNARKASECICQIQSLDLCISVTTFEVYAYASPGISDPPLFLTITRGDTPIRQRVH